MQPCRSTRVETIAWRVHAGVRLTRIIVTLDGRTYRTLNAGERRTKVSLVGLGKRTVVVRVIGETASRARYTLTFTFHTCVPSTGSHGDSSIPYLARS